MYKLFKKLNKRLPRRALTNLDIVKYTRDIPYFRGVYMRDTLPKKPRRIECAILNLDTSDNPGTHWVAYVKLNNYCEYFDSFGNLRPPLELTHYLNGFSIIYNYDKFQSYNSVNCGHLCIKFLRKFWKKNK